MRGIAKAVSVAAVLSTTSPASAATYIFESDDWSEGATFNGRFSVTNVVDTVHPFNITFDLRRFSAEFSGNALVGPLTFGLSDVRYFEYAFDGAIGEDRSWDPDWGAGDYGPYDSLVLENELGRFYVGSDVCHLNVDCGYIYDKQGNLDINYSTLRVTAVPGPATWALLLLGFGTIGAAVRRRRKFSRVAYSF